MNEEGEYQDDPIRPMRLVHDAKPRHVAMIFAGKICFRAEEGNTQNDHKTGTCCQGMLEHSDGIKEEAMRRTTSFDHSRPEPLLRYYHPSDLR